MMVSLAGGTDMYGELQFNQAKSDYAYSILHHHSYNNKTDKVICDFLQSLLFIAAFCECVSKDDVQSVIEGVSTLNNLNAENDEDRRLLAKLWTIGYKYCGQLSPQQAENLRRLRKACVEASVLGDQSALKDVEELLR
jgi:hypothetical protein